MTMKATSRQSARKSSSRSTAKKLYRSKLSASIHQFAEDLHGAGLLSKKTMRELDESCLTPIKTFTPSDLEALRKREEVSQAVFARHLGLSVNLISQWERGEKKPGGASLKLLSLVEKNGLDFVA